MTFFQEIYEGFQKLEIQPRIVEHENGKDMVLTKKTGETLTYHFHQDGTLKNISFPNSDS